MKSASLIDFRALPLFAIALFFALAGCNSKPVPFAPTPLTQVPREFSNADWAKFLATVVTPDGYIQWRMVQNDSDLRDALSRYIGLLNAVSPDNHADLFPTPADRLVYWINAYNAACVFAVVEHDYPGSMLAGSPPGSIFSLERFNFGGQFLTLNDLVAAKLEPAGDSRIFFALSFCAHSAPPLRSSPYDGAVLDAELVDQGRRYLSDPRAAVRDGDAVKLNDLFLSMCKSDFLAGYQKLFGAAPGGILQALQPYVQDDSPIVGATKVESLGFDWNLNRPPR